MNQLHRVIVLLYVLQSYGALAQHDNENSFTDIVRKTLIATAHSCMDHVNATVSDLEHLREEPPYPEKAACIIKCLLEKEIHEQLRKSTGKLQMGTTQWKSMNSLALGKLGELIELVLTCKDVSWIGVVKSNKYSKIGFMTAVTPLVFTNKKKMEHMKRISESCEREVNHEHASPCQLGNEVTTCIFKYAPELHFRA